MSNNSVKTILEDRNGFIWVGTRNGLNWVELLEPDTKGRFWTLLKGYIFQYDRKAGVFRKRFGLAELIDKPENLKKLIRRNSQRLL